MTDPIEPEEPAPLQPEEPPRPEPAPPPPPPGPLPSAATIVRLALDALQSAGSELRVLSASVVVFGVAAVGIQLGSAALYGTALVERGLTGEDIPTEQSIALVVAGFVGIVALLVLVVQIPLLVIATVGARLAGQPLTLRQAFRRSRQVFLRGLGAALLVGLATTIPTGIAQLILVAILGPTQLATGLNLLAGAVFSSPWVYVLPGIVLGGVGVSEALRRSWTIARLRWRIAVTIALLGVVGQFIVVAAALAVIGVLDTLLTVAGAGPDVPESLQPVVAIAITIVGLVVIASIVFGVQLVQFAPQASGFYAMTGYTDGLDAARGGPPEPLFQRRALIFYGVGLVAGLYLLASAIQLATG